VALVVTVTLISATAGLGVLALVMMPLAGVLIATGAGARRLRKRRRGGRRQPW
jgi:hypothetical protein